MKLPTKLLAASSLLLLLLAPCARTLAARPKYSRITAGSIESQYARGSFRSGSGSLYGDGFSLWYTNYDGVRMMPSSKCADLGCAPGEDALPAAYVSPTNYNARGTFTAYRLLLPELYSPVITGGYLSVAAPAVTLPAELRESVELTAPFSLAGRLSVLGRRSADAAYETAFDGMVYGEGTLTMTFESRGGLYFLTRYRFDFQTPQRKPSTRARAGD